MGELACLSGLKLRIAEIILFAMDGRVRKRTPRQLSVALTRTASLRELCQDTVLEPTIWSVYILRILMKDVEESVQ